MNTSPGTRCVDAYRCMYVHSKGSLVNGFNQLRPGCSCALSNDASVLSSTASWLSRSWPLVNSAFSRSAEMFLASITAHAVYKNCPSASSARGCWSMRNPLQSASRAPALRHCSTVFRIPSPWVGRPGHLGADQMHCAQAPPISACSPTAFASSSGEALSAWESMHFAPIVEAGWNLSEMLQFTTVAS